MIDTVTDRHRKRGVIAYATDRPTETIKARDLRPGMTLVTYSGYVLRGDGPEGVGVQYLIPVEEVTHHGGGLRADDGVLRLPDENVTVLYEPRGDPKLQALRELFGGAL